MASDHHLSKAAVIGIPKKKEKPKAQITHTPYSFMFNYSEDKKQLESIDYNITLQTKNIGVDSPDKFRIIQDIKEAIEAVKKKYE